MLTKKIAALLVLLLSVLLMIGWRYQHAIHRPSIEQTMTIVIEKGDSLQKIAEQLATQQTDIHPLWFRLLVFQKQAQQKLKSGEYELKAGLTLIDIVDLLVQGKTKRYKITFPEGWRFQDVLNEIAKNPYLKHTLASDAAKQADFMKKFDAQYAHPEGLFFPDTYFFARNTTDIALLHRAYDKMQSVLSQEWQNKAADLPIKTPYQALILASIIEKETGAGAERPLISGVFSRRLQQNMLLQTDPTVIYGMGDSYQGNIRGSDLKNPTPYNTYVIKGLPPTPIALAGRAAIHAALHPQEGDALYFVAKGDKTHVFSATLQQHNAAVNQFQRKKK
jgi:UPF0755 protein